MKTSLLLALVLVAGTLAGCSTLQDRRVAYVTAHKNNPHRVLILNGKIRVGMTKEEVIAAWGSPCQFCRGTKTLDNGNEQVEFNRNPTSLRRRGWGAGVNLVFDDGVVVGWNQ